MLRDEIEKTLQAHSPEPPEGFAERTDNKVLSLIQKKQERKAVKWKSRYRLPVLATAAMLVLCFVTAATRELITRPDEIRARETTTPLVTAMSEGKGEETGSGAGTGTLPEEAVERLEYEYPGLIKELKAVNLSSEQQGVRLDLISALIKDQELYMIYTIQDPEGERVGNGAGVTTFYDDNFSSGNGSQNILTLSYDETEHKGTYLRKCELDRRARAVEQVMMSFQDLGVSETLYVDLNPQLEQYGKTTEGVTLPEDITVTSYNPDFISDKQNKVVLDYTQPLDEPLWGAVRLTGIGWIDNKLHVQIHNPDASVTTIGRGTHSSWMISLSALITEGEDSRDVDSNTLLWGYTEEKEPTWQEDVWEISPDEKDHLNLRGYVTHITKTLDAKWEFQVPVDTILAETGADTAAGEETLTEAERVRNGAENYVQKVPYDEMIPLGLTSEQQGVRFDLISALIKNQKMYAIYSVQDLDGKRYKNQRFNDLTAAYYEDNIGGGTRSFAGCLDYDEAEYKGTYLVMHDLTEPLPADGQIMMSFTGLVTPKAEYIDLLPILEEYGKAADGMPLPDDAGITGIQTVDLSLHYIEKKTPASGKILDYTQPLDVRLNDMFTLTGIGWIDNKLHVQVHNLKSGDGLAQVPFLWAGLGAIITDQEGSRNAEYELLTWEYSEDGNPAWQEFVCDITPDDVDRLELVAALTSTMSSLEGNWEFQVPVDSILAEAGTTAQEEASAATDAYNEYELKEKLNECLWWFFRNWALGNTDRVTAAFEYEWNTEQADPEESAKEIMKSGTPGGYKIHSVSGKIGDPDCKADVSVLWQEGDSSYTCTRHELEFWLQKGENGNLEYAINPEGFKNGSAVESFPDNPVLMRESDIIREVMEAHIEEVAYDELLPIGLSTEKQGIRMDVVSGCRKGDNVYLLLTTQDLDGKYNEYDCHPTFVYEQGDDVWNGYEVRLNINRAEGKTTWLYRMDLSKELLTENNTLRAGIKQLSFSEHKEFDLLPMLKEHGRTEEGVTPPKESLRSTLDGKPIENKLKALDYKESLDIHLDGNVFLSAIGWIGDQLHVQLQNKSWAMMQEYPDIPYESYLMAVNCHVKDKTFEEIHVDDSMMSWRETYEGPSWEESVFNSTPEDLDRMELYATETISKGIVDGDWTVEIPMEMIRGETSEKPAVEEEKNAEPAALTNAGKENKSDEQIKGTLNAFFEYWVEENTEYLLDVCADEWKEGKPNPEEAANEFIASRKPGGYIINSISGEGNDPVRTADVTVQWDANTYNRYEIPLKFQRVTPAIEAYRVDPEGFGTGIPVEPVAEEKLILLTKEEIIRRAVESPYWIEQGVHYDDLLPINLSVEKQGITMEIVSGCVKKNNAFFLFTVQDAAGKYDGLDLHPVKWASSDEFPTSYAELYHKKSENSSTWFCQMKLPDSFPTEYDSLKWSINQVTPQEEKRVDLIPLLKHYGRTEDGVTPPENAHDRKYEAVDSAGNMKILDPKSAMDIPLLKNVCLSGIGWIDNQLHVQFHNKGRDSIELTNGSKACYYSADARCYVTDKKDEEIKADNSPLLWYGNEELFPVWSEYVFNCGPEDVDQMILEGYLTVYKDMLEDDWSVEVPLDLLLNETGTETPAPEAEKAETETAISYEQALRMEMERWPGVAEELKPVNLSCEKQGIRMRVLSALVKGNEYWAIYAMKDLEGDRINTHYFPRPSENLEENASEWEGTHFYSTPEYGEIYMTHSTFSKPVQPEEGILTLNVKDIALGSRTQLDLIPLLKQYGKTSEGVEPPQVLPIIKAGSVCFDEDVRKAGVKVLDYSDPLDVELEGNVSLSGIGWIGDQLHVQVRCKGNEVYKLTNSPEKYGYDRYSVWVMNYPGEAGYSLNEKLSPLRWGVSDEMSDAAEWHEYIFNSTPADVDRMNLQVRISEVTGVVEDNWEIRIPMDMIQAEGSVEPAAPEAEKDETAAAAQAEPETVSDSAFDAEQYYLTNNLWEYLYSWAGGYRNGMRMYSSSEWKRSVEDPDASLAEILANGLPQGVRVNSISGTSGDPVRTADCTVLMNRNGEEQYERYNLILKREKRGMYYVDTGCLAKPEPVENDPAAEMVSLTDEEIINRKLENRYPGITEQMKPVNLSVEAQGIRFEAVSALVQKQDAWFIYSLEDLENKYPGRRLYPIINENTGSPVDTVLSIPLYNNEAEHKYYYILCPHYAYPVSTVDRDVLLRLTLAQCEQEGIWLDMNPLVKQYAQAVEGIAAPGNIMNTMEDETVDLTEMKVLDYTQPLDIPVCGSLTLTGIGWIDGKLHVQFHHPNNKEVYTNFLGFEQYIPGETDLYSSMSSYKVFEWSDDEGWWSEYIIKTYAPDDVDRVSLETEIWESENILDQMPAIRIPFSSIWIGDEAGETTWSNAAPEY